jgi:hypothetical protein
VRRQRRETVAVGRAAREGAGDGGPIEFLAPRDSIFGGDGPVDFSGIDLDDLPDHDDAAPRSRWLAGIALVVVTGLIVFAVVASSPWDSPASAPATTIGATTVEAADQRLAPTTVPASTGPVTGYVFDRLPAGFAIRGAWTNSNTADADESARGWGAVWATADATRTSGSWISVTLLPYSSGDIGFESTRVLLDGQGQGGRIAMVHDEGDGVMWVTIPMSPPDVQRTVMLRTYGRTFDEVVELASSIGIDDDHPRVVDDRPLFLDPTLLDGYELVASGPTDTDLIDAYMGAGVSDSSTYYTTGEGGGPAVDETYIEINASRYDPNLEPLGRLAVGPLRIFPDTASVPSDFTGDDLVLGVSPSNSNREVVARWRTGDTIIAIRTTIPLADLLDLLPTVRQTTAGEWEVARRRTDYAPPNADISVSTSPPEIGSGILSNGRAWIAELQPPYAALIHWKGASVRVVLSDDQPIGVSTFGSATIALAVAPSESSGSSDDAHLLRVWIDGNVVDEVLLSDVSQIGSTSSFSGRAAALAFEETGPFVVQLVATDETVIAEYASAGADAETSAAADS